MNTPILGSLKISTSLHVGEAMIACWASRPSVKDALVIYHPEDTVRKKLVALVDRHHKLVEIQAVRKLSLAQFVRAICEAMHLPAARTGYECFERIRMKGTAFHVNEAHLLRPDHLSVIIDLSEGYGHRVVLSSTHCDLVPLITDRRAGDGPRWSKFTFPNVAEL